MLDQLDTLIAFALVMLLLSLLIMTLVQAANILLQRRGRHLLWGVEQILEQLGVDASYATAIAKGVLKHPALSPSTRVYASAIRADELARLLREVMPKAEIPDNVREAPWYKRMMAVSNAAAVTSLEGLTGQRAGDPITLQASLWAVAAGLQSQVQQALAAAGGPPINATAEQLRTAMEAALGPALADARQTAANLKTWFDMIMDRTTERFVAWTRWITVGMSFALCLVFQVDALEILQKLFADKQLRATLVAQVDPALKKAEGIVALATGADPLGTQAIKSVHDKLNSDPKTARDAALIAKVPADLDTLEKGENWLKQTVTDPQKQASILKQYNVQFQALAQRRFDDLSESRKQLLDQLEKTQLKLFDTSFDIRRYTEVRHLGGTIMAALLVSLGAPFWFNMLRNLSNLRPIVAGRVEPTQG